MLKNAFQHIGEWNSILENIGNIGSFIEIGTRYGGTFESLAEKTKGKKISIDLPSGGFGGISIKEFNERNNRIKGNFNDCHFIEGDSHNIETVKTLNKILNGEKVDFLFIDGDHTYKGVLADYMIYRQFVKQSGFIAFHDIIDSDFHRVNGCFVHDFWKKMKGKEFVSPDNSDVTEDAKQIGENRFGGIGLVENDFSETNIHLFQIIRDQRSIDLCVNAVNDYIPTLIYNEDNVFFENAVIRKIYETYKFKKSDFIGVTSPIMPQKTFLTIDQLVSKCQGIDVLNYGNLKSIAGNNLNVWTENGNGRKGTNLYMAAVELNDAKILDFDIFKRKWTCLYCNYFICKIAIFEKYIETILTPVMEWLKKSKWIVWDKPEICLKHREKWYPIAVFICECMFGTFLSTKDYNIKDLRDDLPNSGIIIGAK